MCSRILKHLTPLIFLALSACGGDSVSVNDSSIIVPAQADLSGFFRAWSVASSDTGSAINEQTIRTVVSPRAQGESVRLTFSNLYGSTDLILQSVRVAQHSGGVTIDPQTEKSIRFASSDVVTIPPGETRQSDPVDFSIIPFQKITVTYHVKGGADKPTSHSLGNEVSYVSGKNQGIKSSSNLPEDFPTATGEVLFLTAIDAFSNRQTEVIVAVGDSITDGYVGSSLGVFFPDESAAGKDLRYPDFLARRINQRPTDGKQVVVINSGISGNRLLADAMVGFPQFGPSLLSRVDRDVINVPGVKSAIVLIGTNDLGLAPPYTGDQVIAGLKVLISRLKKAGIRVFLGTQTPSQGLLLVSGHGLPTAVAFRNQINEWIRSQKLADGVIDFAETMKDPNKPDALNPLFDSGDRLHPNVKGYKAMADTVDLNQLLR